jgi:hypothetical protein
MLCTWQYISLAHLRCDVEGRTALALQFIYQDLCYGGQGQVSNNIIDSTSNKRAAFLWGLHMNKLTSGQLVIIGGLYGNLVSLSTRYLEED